jgi:hypothetical protein
MSADLARLMEQWRGDSATGAFRPGTETDMGNNQAWNGAFTQANPFDPNGDLYWQNIGGSASEANSGNPGDLYGINDKTYADNAFGKLVDLGVGAVAGAGLGMWGPGAGGADIAALGADQIGAMTPAIESGALGAEFGAGFSPDLAAILDGGLGAGSAIGQLGAGAGFGAGGLAELAGLGAGVPAAGGLLGGLGGAINSVGGLKTILPAVGAIAGATGASGDQKQTTQNQLDPRMAAMLYGQGGFLGQAQDYFNANKNGNPLMTQGADAMKAAYTNPQAQQGFNAMQTQGMGLLGGGSQNDFLDAFKNRKTTAMPDLSQFKQPRSLLG